MMIYLLQQVEYHLCVIPLVRIPPIVHPLTSEANGIKTKAK